MCCALTGTVPHVCSPLVVAHDSAAHTQLVIALPFAFRLYFRPRGLDDGASSTVNPRSGNADERDGGKTSSSDVWKEQVWHLPREHALCTCHPNVYLESRTLVCSECACALPQA